MHACLRSEPPILHRFVTLLLMTVIFVDPAWAGVMLATTPHRSVPIAPAVFDAEALQEALFSGHSAPPLTPGPFQARRTVSFSAERINRQRRIDESVAATAHSDVIARVLRRIGRSLNAAMRPDAASPAFSEPQRPLILPTPRLIFRDAWRFPIQNRFAFRELLHASKMLMIPVVGWFWMNGYRAEMGARLLKGDFAWPNRSQTFWKFTRLGAWIGLSMAAYVAAPVLLLAGIAWWKIWPTAGWAAGLWLAAGFHMFPSLAIPFSRSWNPRDLFIPRLSNLAFLSRGSYWKAWGVIWPAFLLTLASLPTIVGFFFMNAWLYEVTCFSFSSAALDRGQNKGISEITLEELLRWARKRRLPIPAEWTSAPAPSGASIETRPGSASSPHRDLAHAA